MTILIFGKDGQVGQALEKTLCNQDWVDPIIFLGRSDCDLSSESSLTQCLRRYQPQIIINAAAYTAVDQAEDIAQHDLAFAINTKAPALMAQYIAQQDHGLFLHYSTDYVFADSQIRAYRENDLAGPLEKLSSYGRSKLTGEKSIQAIFEKQTQGSAKFVILRTSWVYGDGPNFIRTMLRLAEERDLLKVVADQVGAPTCARWLAQLAIQIGKQHTVNQSLSSGIYHAVPHGYTSWHGLASYVIAKAKALNYPVKANLKIWPIAAIDYPLPAPRPYNSRLDNQKLQNYLQQIQSSIKVDSWQIAVDEYVQKWVSDHIGCKK